MGNRACGEILPSLHQNQARVDSQRKEGVTAWQARPALETEQSDIAITGGDREGGVGGDVSTVMLKCIGLNLPQMDIWAVLTLTYVSQSQRRPPSCCQWPRALRLAGTLSAPCYVPLQSAGGCCCLCLSSASKSNCFLHFCRFHISPSRCWLSWSQTSPPASIIWSVLNRLA